MGFSFLIRFNSALRPELIGPHQGRQQQTVWPVFYWLENSFQPFKSQFNSSGEIVVWNMEFPIYQWICYGVSRVTNLDVLVASKLISAALITAVIYIIYKILGKMSLNNGVRLSGLIIVSLSPFAVYWGSVGMVDSIALLFGVLAIYFYQYSSLNQKDLIFTTFLVLSSMIKPNIGFSYWLFILFVSIDKKDSKLVLTKLGRTLSIMILSTCSWLFYARESSTIGSVLSGLTGFLGTPGQYLSTPYNLVAILSRFLDSVVGILPGVLLLFGLIFLRINGEYLSALLVTIIQIIVFVNVNFQDYYQISIFPLFVIAITGGIQGYFNLLSKVVNHTRINLAIVSIILSFMSFTSKEGISPWYLTSVFGQQPDQDNRYFQLPVSTTFEEFRQYRIRE